MPRFTTANKLLLFTALLSVVGCADEKVASDDNEPLPPFSDLLLPEDRDTTTVWNTQPDSVFEHLSYNRFSEVNGKQYLQLTFSHLAKVTFKEAMSVEGFLFLKPFFADEVRNLNGKWIQITGFLVPIDHSSGFYALSANPYSSCFFCGNSGPESVIDMRMKGKPQLPQGVDNVIAVTGRLRLNEHSFYELTYILEEAELVKQ